MKKLLLTLLFTLLTTIAVHADGFVVSGRVADASTALPLSYANVSVKSQRMAVRTDDEGVYSLRLPAGTQEVTFSIVGYKSKTVKVDLSKNLTLDISLQPAAASLGTVTVTAKESRGITSASRIDRAAMSHLQPTSFADLLELLPGNISKPPSLSGANTISLRETGTLGANGQSVSNDDYNISSLGTLFMVDGAPLSGDANLQSVPGASGSASAEGKSSFVNRGVDMRSISTDDIESVEIVRGIPSAEYGNLTSGLVNIKRTRRATPLSARFKADGYSKLISLGKGFKLGYAHVFNIDAGYLDSRQDPRDSRQNYKRANFSLRLNSVFETPAVEATFTPQLDYTGSFDNTKADPDLTLRKTDDFKSSYNRTALTSGLQLRFKNMTALSSLSLTASAAVQNDRLERRLQVAPQRASIAPVSNAEGVHDGIYLVKEYVSDFVSEGRPVSLFLKAKAGGSLPLASLSNDYKVGAEWNFDKNYGRGQIYDPAKPLSVSWNSRPRNYRTIPALQVVSAYAEDNASLHIARHRLTLQAGVRSIMLVGISDKYENLHGKPYLDPRINLKWDFPAVSVGGHELNVLLSAGYGLTTKMPTVDYLYPQDYYKDLVQLNYYDILSPEEHSRVNLRTYIESPSNAALRPARNRKWELRLGASWAGNRLSVTYYQEKLTSGYRYTSIYRPYAYRRYDASAIDPAALTAPPVLENLPYEDVQVLGGYSQVANGSKIDKRGVEFQFNSARIRPIMTALTVTGAWMRSEYSNSQALFSPISEVIDGTPVSDAFVGLYDSDEGRVNELLNTNFMFDTQIPRWKLVFTTSLQCMWYVKTRRMKENGIPTAYISAADGRLHPFTQAEAEADPRLAALVKHYNDAQYNTMRVPTAMYVNLKATKQIGKALRVALFVNSIFDYLPSYEQNGLTVRRNTEPYFGMELNVTI